MNGPGLAFAERVRVVTVAEEVAALGFAVVGRRARGAGRLADRLGASEVSRYLGAAADDLAGLAPDAIGLRLLADEVRGTLLSSADYRDLEAFLTTGALRHITVGLVSALRAGLGDVAILLSPTADRSFGVALAGIDATLGASLRALAGTGPGDDDASGHSGDGSPAGPPDGVRVSTVVLGLLGAGRKGFSSPLSVPKSPVSKH